MPMLTADMHPEAAKAIAIAEGIFAYEKDSMPPERLVRIAQRLMLREAIERAHMMRHGTYGKLGQTSHFYGRP